MPEHADESALVSGLRAGDPGAYERLVREHGGRMLAVATRIMGNEHDAGDAVQDGFVAAVKGIGSFDGKSRIATWLHRIVVNACLMRLRTRRRRPEESIEALLPRFDRGATGRRPGRCGILPRGPASNGRGCCARAGRPWRGCPTRTGRCWCCGMSRG